eukprot:COSAG06_NODE_7431_length_2493_cov_1.740141_2_plen_202_part_00
MLCCVCACSCFPAAGGMAAIAEAAPAYDALGGTLEVFEGIWHHGWVLPTREQINSFFCKALAAGFSGGWQSVGCGNSTELDVSKENPDFLEWNDAELRVTSTGQVNTVRAVLPSILCPLSSILCTLYSVLCTLYSVLCTLYSVLYHECDSLLSAMQTFSSTHFSVRVRVCDRRLLSASTALPVPGLQRQCITSAPTLRSST